MKKYFFPLIVGLLSATVSYADQENVMMYTTQNHQAIGTVTFTDTPYGLMIVPNLSSLPPGLHGFHIHEHANCAEQGMSAGGHLDPAKTNTHLGPYANGHLGDLPVLFVSANGVANTPMLAPRLKTQDLKN